MKFYRVKSNIQNLDDTHSASARKHWVKEFIRYLILEEVII